jgi:hypothetical protein
MSLDTHIFIQRNDRMKISSSGMLGICGTTRRYIPAPHNRRYENLKSYI